MKPGDVVYLNSGSPVMLVVSNPAVPPGSPESVYVAWVSADGIESAHFDSRMLTKGKAYPISTEKHAPSVKQWLREYGSGDEP